MPVTLADLAADPALRVTAHGDEATLARSVSWVHISELDDPTPFLEGGELLLTTGLALWDDPEVCGDLVIRLRDAGVAGVGFGVGLSHAAVPAALLDAVHEAGLGLLEVPRDVPFIAISKAVSRQLAAEEYAEVQRTADTQRELARVASRPDGPAALVDRLAALIGAWVALLDSSGEPLHASEGSPERVHRALAPHLDTLRSKAGAAVTGTSLAGREVTLQTLGPQPRGFLAAGHDGTLSHTQQHVLNTAASLLTLALEQRHVLVAAHRRLRSGAFELLLSGELALARQPWEQLGSELPEEPVEVFVLRGRATAQAMLDKLEPAARRVRQPPFLAEYAGDVVALAPTGSPGAEWLLGLPDSAVMDSAVIDTVGVSFPGALTEVSSGYRQAVAAARLAGAGVQSFAELGGSGLLRLLPPEDTRSFAESLLRPLVEHDATSRGELLVSLRAWLAQHGQWDPAAGVLGIHRHTLRKRIRKAEEVLGRSLDSPGLRAELWVALQVHGGPEL